MRQQEGRLYTDEELLNLPTLSSSHPHYKEWMVRKRSALKLTRHLSTKKAPHILEIGCGNGWLSHHLATIACSTVIGLDVNFSEVQQAARVFQHVPNLHFMYGDIRNQLFGERKFDVIVFAASIQYFESIESVVDTTLRLLKDDGEIHIVDSPFYAESSIPAAQQRTQVYYEQAGAPLMTQYYFHHSLCSLKGYNVDVLFDPAKWRYQFFGTKNPLYWIKITN